MSTDPRLLKQLLLSQWINNANPLQPSQTGSAEDGSVFAMLLQDLMNHSQSSGSLPGMASTAGVQLTQGPLALGLGNGVLPEDDGLSSRFDGLISAAAAKYGLNPALIKGVVQTESGFRTDSVSHAGAKGLMQLMDDTARGLDVTDPFDPVQNIDGGARFLSYLLRKYDGNISSALAAYNAGPGRVDRLGLTNDALVRDRLSELPQETQHYIHKVLSAAQRWSGPA